MAVNNTARLLSAAASVNATLVSNQPVTLKRISGYNASAAVVYLKLYDKASAPAETDTPRKTLALPAETAFCLDQDDLFGTGLGYRLTTASADNSTAAVAAGDIVGLNIDYFDD
jgi:hypothetical protein